jgi:hypothetical protein
MIQSRASLWPKLAEQLFQTYLSDQPILPHETAPRQANSIRVRISGLDPAEGRNSVGRNRLKSYQI